MLLQPHSSAAQGSPVLAPSPVQCLHTASPSPQVAETCQLAVRRLEWLQEHGEEPGSSPYRSVDPAPPAEETDVATLRAVLLDESRPLFDRYRAMFALRNLGGRDAVLALADGKGWPGAVCSLWVCRGLIHDWISQIQSCVAACTAASRAACPPYSQSARCSLVSHSPFPSLSLWGLPGCAGVSRFWGTASPSWRGCGHPASL